VRGPEWCLYTEKAPLVDLLTAKLEGTIRVDMGPIPLPAETTSMVAIESGNEEFLAWSDWFTNRGVPVGGLYDHIWVPSRIPQTDGKSGAAPR